MDSVNRCRDCGREVTAHGVCPACSSAATSGGSGGAGSQSSAWKAIGERLADAVAPRYEVIRLLGYGGMAGVYLAHEVRLSRPVAIKVMSPSMMMDHRFVARFRQEARTTAMLNHSNIVTVYDVGEENGLFFYSMRYVSGRSVADVMPGLEAPLEFPIIKHWLTDIGNGLDYAHDAGVTHRDVKPANILLNAQGDALVTDFGIAKVVDEPSLTQTGVLVGTPSYMSPEQCSSGHVTGASDQYSLGAVAYLLITGKPPFAGPTPVVLQRQLTDAPTPIESLRPDCPPGLVDVVNRMLAKDPAARFASIGEAIEALGPTQLSRNHSLRPRLAEISASVAEVKLEGGAPSIRTGEILELSANAYDDTGRVLRRETQWLSSNPSIARIERGRLEALSSGQVMVTARCERAEDSLLIQIMPVPLHRLQVTAPPSLIHPGDRFQLETQPLSQDGDVLGDRVVRWDSDDRRVAAVSSQGLVEAKGLGSTTIWARCDDEAVPIEIEVTVPPVVDIEVKGLKPRLTVGDVIELTAIPKAANGTSLSDRPVTWRSLDPDVADLQPSGELRAVGPGRATLEASSEDWTVALEVEVQAVPVARLEVEAPRATLQVGESASLDATAWSSEGDRLEGRAVVWTSANPEVLRVDRAGVIHGLKPGVATITATCGRAAKSLVVQVVAIPVHHIDLVVPFRELEVGDRAGLTAVPVSASGARLTERPVAWTSSDPDVATVDPTGFVEAVGEGTAAITAGCDGVEAYARVTVRDPAADVTQVSGVPASAVPAAVAASPTRSAAATRDGSSPMPSPARRRRGLWLGLGGLATAAVVLFALFGPDRVADADPPAGAATELEAGGAVTDPGAEASQATLGAPEGAADPSNPDAAPDEGDGDAGAAASELATPGQEATPPSSPDPEPAAVPATGLVRITGNLPPGVSVTVSGSGIGRRDVSGGEIDLAPGTYTVEMNAPGYRARSSEVLVSAGGNHEVSGVLTPEAPPEGTVRLGAGLPDGIVVTLRGGGSPPRVLTTQAQSIPPGSYQVESVAPGFRDASQRLTVESGLETVFVPNLERVPEEPAEPAPLTPEEVAPQLQAVLNALGMLVEAQNLDGASNAFPGAASWFQNILPVFRTDQAHAVSVTVGTMGDPVLAAGTATVNVDISVMFRDIRNTEHSLPQALVGVFRQEGAAWILSSLRGR